MNRFKLGLTLAVALGSIVLAPATHAVDGVKLLSQPKTFPITITSPGSYRLKKNLVVPNGNTNAIVINADDVSIDLNGFAILGPNVCTYNPPVVCSQPGSGVGIGALGSHTNLSVKNGTIRGMGSLALFLDKAVVERLRVTSNGGGIAVSNGRVANCLITQNGGDGLGGGGQVTFADNLIAFNGGVGIFNDEAAIVTGNLVVQNGALGIWVAGGLVSGNASQSNDADGIAADAALVANNVSSDNLGRGINGGALITANIAAYNSSFGIRDTLGGAGLTNNAANVNNGGDANPQLSGGVYGGTSDNVCGSDLTCP